MALSDILKKYGDTTGIMQQPYTPPTAKIVPYKSVASSYPVYNKYTDTLEDQQTFNYEPVGIMAQPEGKPVGIEPPFMPDSGLIPMPDPTPKTEQPFVTGPTGVISYGTTEEGTPRLLTDYRTGETTYAQTGEPYTPPPIEPVEPEEPEEPIVDPCPPGYQLIDGVCQPIPQERSDRDEDEPSINIRTNNQKGRDSLENFGIKLTGGEDSIFADPEKTRAMFGTKKTADVRDTPKLASYDEVAARGGLSEEYRQALGPELYDAYEARDKLYNEQGQVPLGKEDEVKSLNAKINELEAARQQEQERLKQEGLTPTSTGERLGELPTFTVEDFETGYPSFLPGAAIVNLLGQAFVAPSSIKQLERNGFIVKTGNKKNNKDEYTLSENGIRSIVQAEVDDNIPALERKAEKAGFTRREIQSGQALRELRDFDRVAPEDDKYDNRAVKAYREAQSKKYTQKEKDAFTAKVEALRGGGVADDEEERKRRIEAGKNLPKQDKDSGGGSDKSDDKIVCTMMNESYGFGSFRNKVWLSHSSQLSKEYEIGYHILFLPLVKYAKQKGFINSIVKNTLEHIARHRTIDIRKQKYNKVDMLGRAYRTLLEPLCYITGRIKLWKKK